MASNEEIAQLPRGQVSFGSGPLQLILDFDAKTANGVKLKSFLRRNPGGYVVGAKVVTGSFNMMVSEDGDERDWDQLVDEAKMQRLIVKAPGGKRKTLNCILTEVGDKTSVEDGYARAISFTGWWVRKK